MASRNHCSSEVLVHPTVLEDWERKPDTRRMHRHVNPTNGSVTCDMPLASIDDMENAVRSARAAFPAWHALAGAKRCDLMLKMATLIERHAKDLVELSTLENGCSATAAAYIAAEAARRFRYFAAQVDNIHARGGTCEHVGVIGAIIHWSRPLAAATEALPSALAAGSCMVIKISKLAPFSVMRLGRMFVEAGFPPGVIHVLVGGSDIDRALGRHPQVDSIQFVGRRT
jgi:aldehyde dehydrogenase (NAD+)